MTVSLLRSYLGVDVQFIGTKFIATTSGNLSKRMSIQDVMSQDSGSFLLGTGR